MGLPAQRLRDMREYNAIVGEMLRGGTATLATEGTTRKVRFLNPENGMLNVGDAVPLSRPNHDRGLDSHHAAPETLTARSRSSPSWSPYTRPCTVSSWPRAQASQTIVV